MCDFHIFIAIFDDISPFHHFDHFFVNFFSCGVWGGCGGVAGLHRKVFIAIQQSRQGRPAGHSRQSTTNKIENNI